MSRLQDLKSETIPISFLLKLSQKSENQKSNSDIHNLKQTINFRKMSSEAYGFTTEVTRSQS